MRLNRRSFSVWGKLGASQSAFASNVMKIASGTALGQGLVFLAMPILTRMFTPAEFGLQGIYVAILSIVLVFSSLRLELALLIPESEQEAASLFLVGICSVCSISLIVFVLTVSFGPGLLRSIHAQELQPFLWWVLPIGVMGGGIFQVVSHWCIRTRSFKLIAKTRLVQGAAQVLTQVGIGAMIPGPLGLLLGADMGRMAGISTLLRSPRLPRLIEFKGLRIEGIFRTLGRYRNFPLVSSWSALLNAFGIYLPILLISKAFESDVAGQFALTQRLFAIPVALIGQAVAQVYMGEGAARLRADPLELHRLVKRTMRNLFLIGLLPTLLAVLVGPSACRAIFGVKWALAGDLVRVTAPMYLVQFVSFPVSQSLNILERQGLQFLWDFSRVLIVSVAIGCSVYFGGSPYVVVATYAWTLLPLYILMLVMVYHTTKNLPVRLVQRS